MKELSIKKHSYSKKSDSNSFAFNALAAFPVSFCAAFSVFSIIILVLLLLENLTSTLVLTTALPPSLITYIFIQREYVRLCKKRIKKQALAVLFLILFLLMWLGINANFTAQNVYVYRDPAIYTVIGLHIVENDNIHFEESKNFEQIEDVKGDTASFGEYEKGEEDRLYTHGLPLLPSVSGVLARLGGEKSDALLLKLAPIYGAFALLAFFAFSRFIVGGAYALAATAILGLSLPLIYFSRDFYTEPLSLGLIFGGLSMISLAFKSKKGRLLWFITGVSMGSIVFARIDGFLIISGLISSVIILKLLFDKPRVEKSTLTETFYMLLGISLSVFVSTLCLLNLSPKYFTDLNKQFEIQLMASLALLSSATIFTILVKTRTLVKLLPKGVVKNRGIVLSVLLLIIFLVLASRPLWYTGYTSNQGKIVELAQISDGVTVEPRTYSEQTINWLWWYLGIPLTIFSLFGLLIAAKRATFKQHAYVLGPFLLVFLVAAIPYIIKPSITADQIWAIRRFLPVVIPGMILLAVYALKSYSDKKLNIKDRTKHLMIGIAVITFSVPVLYTTYPIFKTREFAGQLKQVETLCTHLTERSSVVVVGIHSFNLAESIKTICDVPVERLVEPSPLDIKNIQEIAKTENINVTLVALNEESAWLYSGSVPISSNTFQRTQRTVVGVPKSADEMTRTLYIRHLNQ